MGRQTCKTVYDASLGQYRCEMSNIRAGAGVSGVFLSEVEGEPETVQQCPCQVVHNTVITSVSNVLIVTFKVTDMLPNQDFRDFLLHGSFRFINVHCQDKSLDKRGGHVTLDYHSSEQAICDKRSWSVRAKPRSQIYLQFHGVLLPHDKSHVCETRGRVIVRTAGKMFIICPGRGSHSDQTQVSLWSPMPHETRDTTRDHVTSLQSVSVHLAGQSSGKITFSWIEVTPVAQQAALQRTRAPLDTCSHMCPSLHACANPDLWCDGVKNCPGGWDEEECAHLLVPMYYLYSVVTASAIVFLLTTIVLFCR